MYNGLTAKLMIGETTLAYVSNFSIEESKDIVEITKLGSNTREKMSTLYSWSGSADGTADFENDAAQLLLREAMIAGTAITAKFYLSTTRFLTGDAFVESMSLDISAEDKGNISISLSGVGELEMTPKVTA